jgi:hypothetical protein
MSTNTGLFQWIRDGVRQSVLLGVTDALESIGTPDDGSKVHPALAALNSKATSTMASPSLAAPSLDGGPARNAATGQRKRLGRSLKDINPAPNS